ncbi:hypothetical protein, partial [Segatella salivae]|uniref:hypothetical protein n=1 Tax=Segatella salivae TaxID=228604 RepID=UPI00241FE507
MEKNKIKKLLRFIYFASIFASFFATFVYIFHRFLPHFPLHFARSHPLVSTPAHDNHPHLSPPKFVRSLTNAIHFL